MWIFVKKAFALITTFFNLSYVNSLECITMNNQECKARPKIITVNNNERVFYHMLNCVFQLSLKT